MELSAAGRVDGAGAAGPRVVAGAGEASFEAALGEQARRAAVRDLLAALPPPVAQQVARSRAGGPPPMPGVHAMFEAVQDGSFVPRRARAARAVLAGAGRGRAHVLRPR